MEKEFSEYVKIPVTIKAIQYDGSLEVINAVKKITNTAISVQEDGLLIETLEGNMLARRGDYIIQGVNGELYPCKPDIFQKTYSKK